jgi:hypothetical protein
VDAAGWAADAFGLATGVDVEPAELQAAPPSASPATIAPVARNLTLMIFSPLPSGRAAAGLRWPKGLR